MAITRQNKTGNFVRGFDVIVHNSRMIITISLIWLLVAIGTNISTIFYNLPDGFTQFYFDVQTAKLKSAAAPDEISILHYKGKELKLKSGEIANSKDVDNYVNNSLKNAYDAGLPVGLAISFLLFALGIYASIRRGKLAAEDDVLFGMRRYTAEDAEKLSYEKSSFKVGNVHLPEEWEVKHTLLVGAPGTGKSQVMLPILQEIRRRGDVAIVYDTADVIEKLYDESKDTLFNPLDSRSVSWDPLLEIETENDAREWSGSVIKPKSTNGGGDDSSAFFIDGARIVLREILIKAKETGTPFDKMLSVFETASNEQVAELLSGTAAAKYSDSPKTWGDISGTLNNYIDSLKLVKNTSYGDWTPAKGLDYHLENGGWLWLPTNEAQSNLLAPLVTTIFERIATHVLSLSPNNSRRIWIVMDEFPNLPKLETVIKLLTQGRKFGACVFLGIQSYSQLKKTYGEIGANEIADTCSTFITMRTPSGEGSEWVSKNLGNYMGHEVSESISAGSGDSKDNVSIRDTRQLRNTVAHGEIQQLPELNGFVKIGVGKKKGNIFVAEFKQHITVLPSKFTKFAPLPVKKIIRKQPAKPQMTPTPIHNYEKTKPQVVETNHEEKIAQTEGEQSFW
jgi:hypothetical protein